MELDLLACANSLMESCLGHQLRSVLFIVPESAYARAAQAFPVDSSKTVERVRVEKNNMRHRGLICSCIKKQMVEDIKIDIHIYEK